MKVEVRTLATPELVKQAYSKAREIEKSEPETGLLLRALAMRLDVRNALATLVNKENVQRFEPHYQMHMNHEMVFMRPCPTGGYVQFDVLAGFMGHNTYLQQQINALAAEKTKLEDS